MHIGVAVSPLASRIGWISQDGHPFSILTETDKFSRWANSNFIQ
jgi:hypothetical protein